MTEAEIRQWLIRLGFIPEEEYPCPPPPPAETPA